MDTQLDIYTEKERKGHPWILRRCALEIQKVMPGTLINPLPSRGKVSYFINYALYKDVPGVKVGHYTHLEFGGTTRERFFDTIKKFAWFTVTCDITRSILIGNGVPRRRILSIPYGSDERMQKPITFGVVGRTYPSGRKGEELVAEAVKAGFDVKCWGKGWPCPEMYEGSPWEKLPEFYRNIDYLLITSTNEGGPVPVIDAVASGVPVIAPNVGWCWEYPVIRYDGLGGWVSLKQVMERLTNPPTWQKWAQQHKAFLEAL